MYAVQNPQLENIEGVDEEVKIIYIGHLMQLSNRPKVVNPIEKKWACV